MFPNEEINILIKFITKQNEYSIADIPYSLKGSVESTDLNLFVKELLASDSAKKKSVEKLNFDFIIDGQIIRSNLISHLNERNISPERTIEIEYVLKNEAPQPENCLLHDDWVSGVEINNDYILTGCYDNTVHLWSKLGEHKLVLPGHTLSVKAVTWSTLDDQNAIFISASQDQTAILWHWKVNENSVECVTILRGHERGIDCAKAKYNLVATGGWDTYLKIWSTKLHSSNDTDNEPKKPRIDSGGTKIRTPEITLKGHREAISSLSWIDATSLVSASWDHTIKIWDTQLGGIKQELVGHKAFFALDYNHSNGLLVTGSADRHVRLYDPRSQEGVICKASYTSHSLWVPTVKWSNTNDNLFLSGSYDHCLKMWDRRSIEAPIFDLIGHEDKVLCSDWSNGLIVSGGSDNTLRIFKDQK